ncbi:cell surface glycoprotein (s-layer protein)-like protein [Anaeramoeba ignava]|uniref:Cell surface glycoprotein (S-layer protein)-like protein n=1 Tax=Anaeramoeba ignava TaxID=1746090 RepID=A0A9Q0L724_ANAIG|nr:cell surface glycoprotein (s-layer protein)-like protein [Anaeramoeba ignava]
MSFTIKIFLLFLSSFLIKIFCSSSSSSSIYSTDFFTENVFRNFESKENQFESNFKSNFQYSPPNQTFNPLPVVIVENIIQNNSQSNIKFIAKLLGAGEVFFTNESITFIINNRKIEMKPINGNLNNISSKKTIGKANFMIGKDSSNWFKNLDTFKEIRYENVYPNVDLHFKLDRRSQLKSEFVFHSKTQQNTKDILSQIKWKYTYSEAKEANEDVDFIFNSEKQTLNFFEKNTSKKLFGESKPIAFQNGEKLKCKYSIISIESTKTSEKMIQKHLIFGFEINDRKFQTSSNNFIIDPGFSTFLGGGTTDSAYSLAMDSNNNMFVIGTTNSRDFPVVDPLNQYYSGGNDIFVVKFAPDGLSILFSTYIGTRSVEEGIKVVLDSKDNPVIVGKYLKMFDGDFPTSTNAYMSSCGTYEANQIVLFKLSNDGQEMLFSTLVCGTRNLIATDLVLVNDSIYISADSEGYFPMDDTNKESTNERCIGVEGQSAVFLKLDENATKLQDFICLDGGLFTHIYSIAFNPSHEAIALVGSTARELLPDMHGKKIYTTVACFLVIVNQTNFTDIWNKEYYEGDENDRCLVVVYDDDGFAWIGGSTFSTNLPNTTDGFQPNYTDLSDGFIAKYNWNFSQLLYSSYLGSDMHSDSVFSILFDNQKQVFVTGRGNPLSGNYLYNYASDPEDIYYMQSYFILFNPNVSEIIVSGIIGGGANAVVFNNETVPVLVGLARSPQFVAWNGLRDQSEQYDAFAIKLHNCPPGYFGSNWSSCFGCVEGKYSEGDTQYCTPCESGTYTNQQKTVQCTQCPSGTYAADPGSTFCTTCPAGQFNDGLGQSFCYICSSQIPDICPGADKCAFGRDPNSLCYNCIPGYFHFNYDCKKCPKNTWAIFLAFIIFLIVICALLFRFSGVGVNFPATNILGTFFQLFGAVFSMSLPFPDVIKNFFRYFFGIFCFNLDALASPECSWNFTFYDKYLIAFFLPFYFLAGYGLFYLIARLYYRHNTRKLEKMEKFKNKLVYSSSIVLKFMFIPLAFIALKPFSYTTQGDGQKTLNSDPTIILGSSKWNKFLVLFIIAVILYVVLIPLLFVFILYRVKKHQFSLKHAKLYGWMYLRFQKNRYWWELVDITFKFILIVGALFFFKANGWIVFVLILLMILFTVIMKPHQDHIIHTINYSAYDILVIGLYLLLLGFLSLGLKVFGVILFSICVFVSLVLLSFAISYIVKGYGKRKNLPRTTSQPNKTDLELDEINDSNSSDNDNTSHIDSNTKSQNQKDGFENDNIIIDDNDNDNDPKKNQNSNNQEIETEAKETDDETDQKDETDEKDENDDDNDDDDDDNNVEKWNSDFANNHNQNKNQIQNPIQIKIQNSESSSKLTPRNSLTHDDILQIPLPILDDDSNSN